MRILHVADYVMPSMGYQEFLLPKWNARHGNDVHIITSDRYTPVQDYDATWRPLLGDRMRPSGAESVQNVRIHRLRCRFEFRRRIWLRGLRHEILRIAPDIMFGHGTSSPLAFGLAGISRRHGIPLILDNHMAYVARRGGVLGATWYYGLKALSRRLLNDRVARFVGLGRESCEFMVREQGIDRSKVVRVDQAVDSDLFFPDDESAAVIRRSNGVPPAAKVVMQTGKLTSDKSPQWLANAVVPLMRSDSQVWLVYVGGGGKSDIERVRAPLESAGFANRLLILPMVEVERLRGYYSMADVCVYPDASSLSCLESACCGRPTIVADLPLGLERGQAGVTICYARGQVQDLTERLGALLEDLDNARKAGAWARAAVMAHYSYDAVAKAVESIMDQVLSERPEAARRYVA